MDNMFPTDDISDGFWSPHELPHGLHHGADVEQPSSSAAAAVMNRSSSEWAFQRFLQEATSPHHHTTTTLQTDDVVEMKTDHHHRNDNQTQPVAQNIPTDPEKYQEFLKSRLELACAAVALTRGTNGIAPESAGIESSSSARGRDSSKMEVKDSVGTVGVPSLPAIPRKSMAQVRSTTSGSSGDQSDDDEAEGETEDTQNTDPADTKRMRRMLSNRESARRSRRRKQVNLTERETQVSQLRLENSSLLKCLADTNQKYNESAVDNRVLKADVETLRAKVKMAEDSVKRVTGLNPLFHAMSETSPPILDHPNQHYYHSYNHK